MKDKTIHFRVSSGECKKICDLTDKEGCTVSKYTAERILYQNRRYNPSVMIRLENIRNIIDEDSSAVRAESKSRR